MGRSGWFDRGQVAAFEQHVRAFGEGFCRGDIEVERVSHPVNDIEVRADIQCVLDGLLAHPGGTQRRNIARTNCIRCERHLLEKAERHPQFLVNWRGVPVVQHGLDNVLVKFLRRNCAMNPGSIPAVILTRDEGSEQLTLADGPVGRTAQALL
jgi:hypothetical protein